MYWARILSGDTPCMRNTAMSRCDGETMSSTSSPPPRRMCMAAPTEIASWPRPTYTPPTIFPCR